MSTEQHTSRGLTAADPLTSRGVPVERELRVLALGSFASRFGAGAVMTTSALYFTRQVGFSATEVALALSAAGIVGLIVQVPAGQLADTRGPREVLMWLMVGTAVFAFPPVLATTPVMLALLLGLMALFERASFAVRAGIVAQVARGGRGVLFKAYLRAVTNTALGLGSVVGGLALLVDETWAYVAVFALNACFTGLSALVTRGLPHLPPTPHVAGEPRLAVARDLPFVVVVVLSGLYSLHFLVMDLGIALYISEHTEAPTVMVAVLLVMNTAVVALFQVRLSRRSDSVLAGARALVIGGWFIAGGFIVVALADGGDARTAVVLLIVGALVHVVGEMIGSGGQWGVQMGLAPHEKQGQYQGFAGLSWSVLEILGPPVVAFFCVEQGARGWLMLAVMTVVVAMLCLPATRWALATREQYGVTTHSG